MNLGYYVICRELALVFLAVVNRLPCHQYGCLFRGKTDGETKLFDVQHFLERRKPSSGFVQQALISSQLVLVFGFYVS